MTTDSVVYLTSSHKLISPLSLGSTSLPIASESFSRRRWSANRIRSVGKFFDNPSTPVPFPARMPCTASKSSPPPPPAEAHRCPRHSMSKFVIDNSNHFRNSFGFNRIKHHPAVEHHSDLDHGKFVVVLTIATMPVPPILNNLERRRETHPAGRTHGKREHTSSPPLSLPSSLPLPHLQRRRWWVHLYTARGHVHFPVKASPALRSGLPPEGLQTSSRTPLAEGGR